MSQSLEESYSTLKQAIALLVKHQISAVPTNYALWYGYAANQSDALKDELDKLVEQARPLSDQNAKALYRHYLADKEEVDAWQLRQSLDALVVELSNSITDTRADTSKFRHALDKSFEDLERAESEGLKLDEVMTSVRKLVSEAHQIRESTQHFNSALDKAQGEILSLKEQLAKSQQDALYDSLTGLYNRRFFDDEFAAYRDEPDLCMILVDIDHFKSVNDNYGHYMGDLVLKAVARKLRDECGDNASAFRYGGEEFAILLRKSSLRGAMHQAEVMRKAIERVNVIDRRKGTRLNAVTASFGVAQNIPCEDRRNDLIERADKLLYEAKNLGRNRVMPMPL